MQLNGMRYKRDAMTLGCNEQCSMDNMVSAPGPLFRSWFLRVLFPAPSWGLPRMVLVLEQLAESAPELRLEDCLEGLRQSQRSRREVTVTYVSLRTGAARIWFRTCCLKAATSVMIMAFMPSDDSSDSKPKSKV